MGIKRYELDEAQWGRIAMLLPGKAGDPGRTGSDSRVFDTLTADRDNRYLMIDSTIVRAHQQAASGKGGPRIALGRSRGGLSTRIHMLADTLGRPCGSGSRPDRPAISHRRPTSSTARGPTPCYDGNDLSDRIAAMQAQAVIPSKRNRKVPIPHDVELYKHRNRIECCFNRLKHFRRLATRYDRRTVHFAGFVHLAVAAIWLT